MDNVQEAVGVSEEPRLTGFGLPVAPATEERVAAPTAPRVIGFLIDILPVLPFGLLNLIPIAGPILFGVVVAPYWLLRDITGASLGKRVLGMRVRTERGERASMFATVLRNLPLAGPYFFLLVPLIGPLLTAAFGTIAVLIEIIALVARGRRIGDLIAGTTVVIAKDRGW
jgi:uncharacterized RDD family membrane protein YckC